MKKLLLAVALISAGSTIAAPTLEQQITGLHEAGLTVEEIVTQAVADDLGITLQELQEIVNKVLTPNT